jgi:hypothetical protein
VNGGGFISVDGAAVVEQDAKVAFSAGLAVRSCQRGILIAHLKRFRRSSRERVVMMSDMMRCVRGGAGVIKGAACWD